MTGMSGSLLVNIAPIAERHEYTEIPYTRNGFASYAGRFSTQQALVHWRESRSGSTSDVSPTRADARSSGESGLGLTGPPLHAMIE